MEDGWQAGRGASPLKRAEERVRGELVTGPKRTGLVATASHVNVAYSQYTSLKDFGAWLLAQAYCIFA